MDIKIYCKLRSDEMSIKKSVRFILTDVLPFELPIIFDNKDFAEYLSLNFEKIRNLSFGKMLKQLSLPYDYNIIKDNKNVRRISLMNPLSQIQSSYFIDKYDRSEEHTSELQSRPHLVCRLLL